MVQMRLQFELAILAVLLAGSWWLYQNVWLFVCIHLDTRVYISS